MRLRPLVELNARFTLGHVCTGWLRRLHPKVVAHTRLEPGRRIGFLFALAPPGDDVTFAERVRASGALRFDLAGEAPGPAEADAAFAAPFVLFHDEPGALRPLAASLRGRSE